MDLAGVDVHVTLTPQIKALAWLAWTGESFDGLEGFDGGDDYAVGFTVQTTPPDSTRHRWASRLSHDCAGSAYLAGHSMDDDSRGKHTRAHSSLSPPESPQRLAGTHRGRGKYRWHLATVASPRGAAVWRSGALPVPAMPALYIINALKHSSFGTKVVPQSAVHNGLSVIVGRHHDRNFPDTVYLLVRMSPETKTYKVVLAWKDRKSTRKDGGGNEAAPHNR
jgi:hypothetical protein